MTLWPESVSVCREATRPSERRPTEGEADVRGSPAVVVQLVPVLYRGSEME